jgi:hypothetical protein
MTEDLITYDSNNRPTFYYENDKNKPIRAGGVLIYKKDDEHIKVLLIKKLTFGDNLHEDIGGKTDKEDLNILDTISREVSEETNKIIDKEIIKEQLKNGKPLYVPFSKYMLYLIEANEEQKKLKTHLFGSLELHDKLKRRIYWIKIQNFINDRYNFNPRMNNQPIKTYINNFFNL